MKMIPTTLAILATLLGATFQPVLAEAKTKIEVDLNFPFPFPFPGGPGFPDRGDSRPNRPGELVYERIQQQYRGETVLPLRQILNLGPQYRGQSIRAVILDAATAGGRGEATVLVNGQAVSGTQIVGRNMDRYRFQLPQFADELGHEIQQLQIVLRGHFFVEGVGVRMERGNGGFPGRPMRETIHINREFRGAEQIRLADYVNMAQYRGMRLVNVELTASTRFGRGDATFCNSLGCDTAQDVDTVIRTYSFRTGSDTVDRDAQSWAMNLRGNFYVQSIQLEFAR
jgi:hypothetical protein